MGLSKKKKSALIAEINKLQNTKRRGLLQSVIAFVGLALCIWVKLTFQAQGAAWAQSDFASMALFLLALVAAGFAGIGMRNWNRARMRINEIMKKL